jgi:aspartate aminotransferase
MLEAIRSFQPRVVAYGPSSGLPACREAAAAYHSAWSPGLSAADVSVTAGGSEALLFAFTATCDPGDEILAPEPYYTNYNGFATVAGATVRPLPTSIEDGFALPSDEVLDAHVGPRTRAIVFANPGNPTGVVYSRESLLRVGAWAKRRDLFIIADEVYRRIWFHSAPTSMLEFEDLREHVLCVDSLSKTYSACGARLGFLICRNAELMARVERLAQARLGPQPLAQHVAIAALGLPESHYEEIRAVYRGRVLAMHAALSALPGVHAHRPDGAFYLMSRLPVADTEAFARYLAADFEHEGESLMLAPGPGFYSDPNKGRDQVRLAAVLEEGRIARGVELLGRALDQWRG